jgi:hypothetical protein
VIEKIPLEGRIKGGASLEFISVEVPFEPDRYIPFALVRYRIAGERKNDGLRLDLDKATFADHFADEERERVLRAAGPQIVKIAGDALRRLTYERLKREFA